MNTLGPCSTRLNKIVNSCTQNCNLGSPRRILPKIKGRNIPVITQVVAVSRNGIWVAVTAGNLSHALPMIKYLNSRNCPSCRSTVTTMMVRYNSRLTAVNGVCSRCDYSMKWLVLGGNLSKPASLNLTNRSIAKRSVNSGPTKNLEVLSS